ncbi:MAG: hypothetical protein PHD66_04475 [Eubacteriales bacterium]|nr:hypothetical protein [Eubacteriales bacterium]
MYYDIRDYDDYGLKYLSQHLGTGFDTRLLPGIDTWNLGSDMIRRDGAKITDYGTVCRIKDPYSLIDDQTQYELIEVCGHTAMFSDSRVDRITLPKCLYAYDIRHSDYGDVSDFRTLEKYVMVNNAGTVITKHPVDLGKDGYIVFTEETLPNFLGEMITPRQFLSSDFEAHQSQETEVQQL